MFYKEDNWKIWVCPAMVSVKIWAYPKQKYCTIVHSHIKLFSIWVPSSSFSLLPYLTDLLVYFPFVFLILLPVINQSKIYLKKKKKSHWWVNGAGYFYTVLLYSMEASELYLVLLRRYQKLSSSCGVLRLISDYVPCCLVG